MVKFFAFRRSRYAFIVFVIAGALVVAAAQCEPTKPPAGSSLSIAPTSHDFGDQPVGAGQINEQAFTVTNNGPGSSGDITVAFGGNDPNDFNIFDNACLGALDANETCDVVVTFDPNTAGAKSANLNVSGAAGAATTATVTGIGTEPF